MNAERQQGRLYQRMLFGAPQENLRHGAGGDGGTETAACEEPQTFTAFDQARALTQHLMEEGVEIPKPGGGTRQLGIPTVVDRLVQQAILQVLEPILDPTFAGEKVPTVEEVLALIADRRQIDVLIAVDLKAEGVEQDVVRVAEKHRILHRLLFIGRTITEPAVRERIKAASTQAQTATIANNADEAAGQYPQALTPTRRSIGKARRGDGRHPTTRCEAKHQR